MRGALSIVFSRQRKLIMKKIVVFLAAVACFAANANGVTAEDLKALRAQKKELCLKDAECNAKLETKKQTRRDKAAEKLKAEIASMSK